MRKRHHTRTFKLLPALVLVALVIPSAASGQATRTWVSGVGDDVNPCSRTAPCKTFAGAISKTATGGIINAIDDGGFGAVTITKSITIDAGHHIAGVLASGGINAINVNAPGGRVVLRNLDIEGNGTTLGLNGINVIAAKSLKVQNVQISAFSRSGILFVGVAGVNRMVVIDSRIHDNGGNGVTVAPPNGATNVATVRNTDLDENICGVATTQFGMNNVFTGNDCGTPAPNGGTGFAIANVFDSGFAANTNAGGFANGGLSVVRMSNNDVLGSAFGIRQINGGQIKSWGNNLFGDNGADGVFNPPNITPLKVAAH
jgi:hypothetical protein